jgi:hypothetical protein
MGAASLRKPRGVRPPIRRLFQQYYSWRRILVREAGCATAESAGFVKEFALNRLGPLGVTVKASELGHLRRFQADALAHSTVPISGDV